MILYKLLDIEKDRFVHPDNTWRRSVLGRTFCRECYTVDRRCYPQPVDARLKYVPPGMNIGVVSWAVVGIIHVRLLEHLGDYFGTFAIGRAYDRDGVLLTEYRTWYGKTFIEPRGEAGSEWRVCPVCGRRFYHWKGNPYVLSHEVGDHHVYHDAGCHLYVDEWLAQHLDWSGFTDFELYPFPVRDTPLDGFRLPGDPDWSARGEGG